MEAKRPIDIEDLLIWTYQTQRADRVIRADEEAMPSGPSDRLSASALRELALAGVALSAAQGVYVPRSLHPDAEVVHEAVGMLPSKMRYMIVVSARTGERPDWTAGPVRMEPHWRELGSGELKPVVLYDRNRRPIMCPVEPRPTADEYRMARENWSCWHAGLVRLVGLLAEWPDCLRDFQPTGPAAPACPWLRPALVGQEPEGA